jgi:MFS family permease
MELRAPLRRGAFRRLTAAYALNELGDWLGLIALAVLVFDKTGGALATTGLFLGTRFAPSLFGPLLVVRVERARPRFALPAIYCCEALTFGGLAVLASHFSLAAVIALATIDGTLALAGRALTRAVVGALLEPTGELRAGNAILNIAFTAGAAVGPAIAGLMVSGVGVQVALLLDAASFYAIACLMLAGPLPRATREETSWRARLREGIAYTRANKALRRLLTAQGAAFIFFAAVIPIEVVYAKQTLAASDSGYGALLASWGAGMLIGSVLFAGMRRGPLPVLLLISTLVVGAAYLGLAAAPTLGLACAASAVGGIGNGVQWVSLVTAVQEMTRQFLQARVMAVLESVGAAMPGLGYLLGGLVATAFDPRATFLVAGIGVLAVVMVAAPLLRGTRWTKPPTAAGPADVASREGDILDLPLPGAPGRPPG